MWSNFKGAAVQLFQVIRTRISNEIKWEMLYTGMSNGAWDLVSGGLIITGNVGIGTTSPSHILKVME